jgi:hypothetical protein
MGDFVKGIKNFKAHLRDDEARAEGGTLPTKDHSPS